MESYVVAGSHGVRSDVNFSEKPASKQWAALTYRGDQFAGVWFKPEGEPWGLTFRIPQKSFQIPGMGPQLTPDNLLKAVGIAAEEVESWRQGDVCQSGMDGANPELRTPLAPPAPDAPHVDIHVRLKPPSPAVAPGENAGAEIPSVTWEDLQARWKALAGLEAAIDALRISMEGLRAEMEGLSKRPLMAEEKLHALRADVAQWTKAKSRVIHALPKVKEFIHRAVWAMGTPERKQLEELYQNHIRPHIPLPRMDKVLGLLENMIKDRQVLSAHGVTVNQECRSITAEVQTALRTLQSGAAANAHKKRTAPGAKGKHS
jgi:hypothetical protein